jgi:hypothetical protein
MRDDLSFLVENRKSVLKMTDDDSWSGQTLQLLIVKSTNKKSVETLYFVQLKNYYYCDGDQHLLKDVSFCADYGFPKNLLKI